MFDGSNPLRVTRALHLVGGIEAITLAGARTMTRADGQYLRIDPGGANRTITEIPEETNEGLWRFVYNSADANEVLTINNDAAGLIVQLHQGEWAIYGITGLRPADSPAWVVIAESGTSSIIAQLNDSAILYGGNDRDWSIGHDGTTGLDILVAANDTGAFRVAQGANTFIAVDSTAGSLALNLGQNVNATAGLDVTGAALTAAAGLTLTVSGITMTALDIGAGGARAGTIYCTTLDATNVVTDGTNNTSFAINEDAAAGGDESATLTLRGSDTTVVAGETNSLFVYSLVNDADAGGAAAAPTLEISVTDDGTRISPRIYIGQRAETTASLDAFLFFSAATDAGVNDTADIRWLGQEGDLVLGTGATSVSSAVNFDAEAGLDVSGGNLTLGDNDITGVDEVLLTDAAANASAAGRIRRNGAVLTWHDGTAVRQLLGGDANLTANGLVYGTAAARATSLGAATNGQLPIGSTGAAPVLGSLTAPAAGFTISGGAGTITFALANDLAAYEALAANGLVARTGDGTASARTIVAGSASITVANGGGVADNPSIDTAQNIQTGATPQFARLGLGAPADAAFLWALATSGSVGMVANNAATQTLTIDAQNGGAGNGVLTLTADNTVNIGDAGNPAIDFPGTGAITHTGNPTINMGTGALTLGGTVAVNAALTLSAGMTIGGGANRTLDNAAAELLLAHDDVLTVADPADTTKRARVDVGAVTAGQTRVIAAADRDVDLDYALVRQVTTLTVANLLDLELTPITIVSAPGAGKIAVLDHVVFFLDFSVAALDDAAGQGNLAVQYATSNDVILVQEADGLIDAAADAIRVATPESTVGTAQDIIPTANEAIEIFNNGATFANTGGSTSTLIVHAYYRILPSPL